QPLIDSRGQLIDTPSTYGDAERVLGSVIANEGFRGKVFVATKLGAPDAAELKRSLSRLKTVKLDLLQLHNVRNRRQSLAQFKAWKSQGVCRYVGVTSTFHDDFPAKFSGRAHSRWTSWTQADPDPMCFRSCIVDTQHRRAVAHAAAKLSELQIRSSALSNLVPR